MLVEFRVENHRSLRDEQALSMEAAVRDEGDAQPQDGVANPQYLPVAALYGANASGKSNLLSALGFMRDAVVHSHRLWPPDEGVPRDPYAWGPKRDASSFFEAVFMIDGVRHEYGFVIDDSRILEEWLHVWPLGRKQMWFERDRDDFKFGENLKGENRLSSKITRENGLFLSAAVQNRHEQLVPVFRWFRRLRVFNIAGGPPPSTPFAFVEAVSRALMREPTQLSLFHDNASEERTARSAQSTRLEAFRALLRAADASIVDFRIESEAQEELSGALVPYNRKKPRFRMYFQHKNSIADAWLPLEQESNGTKQLVGLAPHLLDALSHGSLLVIDELERSFHPLLALFLVQTFNCPKLNPQNAQLIFSTHDTNLLGTTLGEPALRRDQIWLTEKDDDGSTRVYPLTDFKPRKAENLERGYLQGRYGAIPFLGNIDLIGK